MEIKPPASVASVAKAALQMRKEQPPSKRGGTPVGVARAVQLSQRRVLSAQTVRRMASFFARHEVDKEAEGFHKGEEGFPSKGRQAWDLWGGDAGRAWANKVLRQLDSGQGVSEMIDVKVLAGADIRRIDGKFGKVSKVSLPWVTVEWSDGKTESFLRSDEALSEDIELKTLDKGWISLGSVVGTEVEESKKTEELSALDEALAELRRLRQPNRIAEAKERVLEAKKAEKKKKRKHNAPNPTNPFYNYKTLNNFRRKGKKRKQMNRWKCSQKGGVQVCIAQVDIPDQGVKKGQKKIVAPWAGKAAYTKEYDAARETGKHKPGNEKETTPTRHVHY